MKMRNQLYEMIQQNHKHHRRRRTTVKEEVKQTMIPSSRNALILLLAPLLILSILSYYAKPSNAQQTQNFLLPGHNMENFRINELTPVNSVVYQLKALDKSNENRKFAYHLLSDVFEVDKQSGEVRLIRPLDREKKADFSVVVLVLDDETETKNDSPLETKRRTVIVEDADDSWPIFAPNKYSLFSTTPQTQYVYQVDVSELALINTIVIADIQVTDADEGINAELNFECRTKLSTNNACDVFHIDVRILKSGKYNLTLKTKIQLDYENVQSYKLSLFARSKRPSPLKGVPLESEAVINIRLINVQDEVPVFTNAPYSLSMHEGLKSGTRLLNLIVQDGDSAPQRDLSMIVVPSLFSEYFQVTKDPEFSRVWYLETNATIDRESALINDAGNMFTISLLAAELDESGSPVASELELVNAMASSSYSRGTLRKENVTIVVLDLPDSSPVFIETSTGRPIKENYFVVNVSESILTGASIPNLNLAVHDLDQGINSRFNVSLIDAEFGPVASNAFALETEVIYGKSEIVLNVLNASLLDFENPNYRSYKFNLVASKNETLLQNLEMQINIVDANDNSPEFDRDQYVLDVTEGALPGTVVAVIKAKDRDSGDFGKVHYMLRGSGASKFKLISSEGKIVVHDCGFPQCIDYETQPSFSLTYEATDGGGRMRNVSVIINVIDTNDHSPKFTESVYKRELISDNLSSKQNYISPQLIVRAKDGDGPSQGRNNITYRMKSTNLTSLDVDPISGLVYFSQPLDLDSMISAVNNGRASDKKIVFEAEVIAEDNGSPMQNASAKILLVVKGNRDGAPQFKQDLYQALIREDQPINKPFFRVQAIDPDEKDSQLRYSLGYDPNDLININANSGELSFKTKVDFDDFKGEPYNVTVYSTDNSRPYPLRASAMVSIMIQDVNDKMPKFDEKEYKGTLIQGRTKVGDIVLNVKALDSDKSANLNYSIISDRMSMHDRNGEQMTLENVANSTTGYLTQMNRIDRQQLVDRLKRLFDINKKTGAIELKQEPDYSFAASITILVKVQDLNQEIYTPTGELQQDFVNCTFFLQTHIDRSPIFAPPWSIDNRNYNISILEELPIGSPIFSLLAKDPLTTDRIETFEKIFETDPHDYFRVERSGIVLINRRIDYEDLSVPRMVLSVKALSEDIFFSVANLNIQIVDLNDNAPQFKSSNYSVSVSETAVYPQEILTVSAEDRDSNEFGQVFYSLSGYSSDFFTIDSKKGLISVKKGVKLDRDTEPSHHLFVIASDCNESINKLEGNCKKSSAFVTITLTDENDNEPVFANLNKRGDLEALTSETVSIGSVIAQAVAVDADEGSNGQVSYEIVRGDDPVSNLLRIDQDGYISSAESLSGLGRSSPYRVIIRAFDNGKSSRQSYVNLLLTISDVVKNDGVPKFIRPKPDEVINLSESSGPSTFVYQVQAVDPDEETNGKPMYKFIQPSDTFEIDPFTGIIKTQFKSKFHLDREQTPNYTLIIVAHDLGTPPKQAHQVLNIKITDINDNEPYFERAVEDPPVVFYVEEEVPNDSLIGTVQAIDKDVGQNALIGYEIIEGNHNNMFRLDYELENNSSDAGNNPCRIYSTARLDREAKESYNLIIRTSSLSKLRNPFPHKLRDPLGSRNPFNQYNASDLTKLRITIILLDVNDNKPVFAQQNAKSVVDSSAEVYSQLMVFKATDADSSNSEIQYSILDALYYSDSRLNVEDELMIGKVNQQQPIDARKVFDMDSKTGILRNSVSLRSYTDGYFEISVKADSGLFNRVSNEDSLSKKTSKCHETSGNNTDPENCFVAVTKAVIFVTHQRETFRFVFNKTKLNDRLDEFKVKIQNALEEMMFAPSSAQASTDPSGNVVETPKAEKIYLNTFNTDFYEREDGSLDFSTLTSCSQLVKFDDRLIGSQEDQLSRSIFSNGAFNGNTIVPNQVVNYDEVLNMLKKLNATQMRQQKSPSLFNQYGLVNIERCLPDKTLYKMSLAEQVSLYFAAAIALIGLLLAYIVSQMRKSYEKNLKFLQRSKYSPYMSPYNTLPHGMLSPRQAHHMSLGTIPGNNFIAPPYGSHLDYDGLSHDNRQL